MPVILLLSVKLAVLCLLVFPFLVFIISISSIRVEIVVLSIVLLSFLPLFIRLLCSTKSLPLLRFCWVCVSLFSISIELLASTHACCLVGELVLISRYIILLFGILVWKNVVGFCNVFELFFISLRLTCSRIWMVLPCKGIVYLFDICLRCSFLNSKLCIVVCICAERCCCAEVPKRLKCNMAQFRIE